MISKRIRILALLTSLVMVLGVISSCGFTTNGTSKRHRDDDDDDRYEYDDDEDEDKGDLMCYSFYGCESSTVWIYRWVE